MSINLIDSLLNESPRIDHDKKIIHSDIHLSDVIGYDVSSEEKSELVNIADYLDELDSRSRGNLYYNNYSYGISNTIPQNWKYNKIWNGLGLERLVISKRLLNFLIKESDLYIIMKMFSMDWSFIMEKRSQVIKCFTIITDKYNYIREHKDGYLLYGDKGSKLRYGKFINMIQDVFFFDNKDQFYRKNRMIELEKSVDIYKSKFNTDGYRICVLNGSDILLGYNRDYQLQISGSMLNQSCMNDKLNYLKLYEKNTDKIYLFVITNNKGKIISRNLVWRLKKYNNFLFDRVYAIDNYISKAAKELAICEGWVVYDEGYGINELKKIDKNGNPKKVKGKTVRIKLNFNGVKTYPYLDTFKYQRRWTNIMTNKIMARLSYCYDRTNGSRGVY